MVGYVIREDGKAAAYWLGMAGILDDWVCCNILALCDDLNAKDYQ
jgi:hypothetical protein